jgi:Peptidase C65 Otubain
MVNINPTHLAQEISLNLDVMQRTLDKGGHIDLGFIEIFAKDLDNLIAQNQSAPQKINNEVITRLQGQLAELADRCTEVAQKTIPNSSTSKSPEMKDVVVPLIGSTTSLKTLAEVYDNGSNTKKGLEQLDAEYQYYPIKGDGHCMYRSAVAGALSGLAALPVDRRVTFMNSLQSTVQTLGRNSPELANGYNTFASAVDRLTSHEHPATLEEIMIHSQISNDLVKFTRTLACSWNKLYGNEVFENEAIVYAGSKDLYLADQVDMQKADLGGNPEIVALSNVFKIGFTVLNAPVIGRGDLSAGRMDFSVADKFYDILMLYRPGHYDLAVKKSAQV